MAPARDEPETRARVIDAAVACILDEGFYRASSNRIAVVRQSVERLRDTLASTTITGDTTEARLAALADAVWSAYGQPEFLAYVQTTLNLTRDPHTAARAAAALHELEAPIAELWAERMAETLPGADPVGASSVVAHVRVVRPRRDGGHGTLSP